MFILIFVLVQLVSVWAQKDREVTAAKRLQQLKARYPDDQKKTGVEEMSKWFIDGGSQPVSFHRLVLNSLYRTVHEAGVESNKKMLENYGYLKSFNMVVLAMSVDVRPLCEIVDGAHRYQAD